MNGHTESIRTIAFTRDERYLISGSNESSIRVWNLKSKNLLKTCDFDNSFDTFLLLNCIEKKTEANSVYCSKTLSPLRINLAHIYCYLSYPGLLKVAYDNGVPIKIDSTGKSPLFYAIERRSQNCIDVTLSYLNELHETNKELFFSYC